MKVYSRNASGLPVLFWIHGGGFVRGSGNQYGVKDLVKKNIVVVTFNYRLGTLGNFIFFIGIVRYKFRVLNATTMH